MAHQLKTSATLLQLISSSASLDAELLLAKVLDKDRSYFRTWPERLLSDAETKQYGTLIESRCKGIPIAYILGEQEFWSMPLKVTKDVLIPRADTERLVELSLIASKNFEQPQILELGTGSGAISIALSHELVTKKAVITAIDISPAALSIAQDNAKQWQKHPIQFIQSDWYQALDQQYFDLIISNPPYIEQNDPHLLNDIRHEPQQALVSGDDGLDAIRTIVSEAPQYLNPQGYLLLEHGFQQAKKVQAIMQGYGLTQIETYQDYAGLDRVTLGRIA
ncbi:MAG: peptide chain release factor N(5)-glutamine methyltransferase [Thiotrichaceae bacterium]|nr:peptide chain release factor N(5)-glutamine methyltransferase [Thiotrichaceae bacterium]